MATKTGYGILDAIYAADNAKVLALLAANPHELTETGYIAGGSLLHVAARKGNTALVAAMLDLGAPVDIAAAMEGEAPITRAAGAGAADTVQLLIARGARLDTSKSVRNPLFAAISGGHPGIVAMLLSAGIDASVRYDSPTMDGVDAIAFALMNGQQACAEAIVAHLSGGDPVRARSLLAKAGQDTTAGRMRVVEKPLAAEIFAYPRDWSTEVWERSGLRAQFGNDLDRVVAIDRFVAAWVDDGASPIPAVPADDLHILLGFHWGQALVDTLGWHWALLSFPDHDWEAQAVVDDDGSRMILPYAHIVECVDRGERDSRIGAVFSALRAGTLPAMPAGSYTDVMDHSIRLLG